jgi:Prealbumin-like fold domain
MTERVLGPSGSKRRKTRLLVLTALTTAAFAVFFVVGAGAIVGGSPSNFESQDGDMTLGASGHTDWNCFAGAGNTGGFSTAVSSPAGCAKTSGATQVTADANGEITWVNGQKFDEECPALTTGNVPNKDDFTHIAEYQETASGGANNGDLYFYGGAIRATSNGNASGDVEFNQVAGDGTTTAGCRSAGDRLIAYDFLGGGQQPLKLEFHVLTWITAAKPNEGGNNGTCLTKNKTVPCWGAIVITPDSSVFEGAANALAITALQNGISNEALAIQQFAEFGINLTDALGGGALPCFPQQVWESRSSGSSFVSAPEDIEFAHLSTCGSITIIKHTNPRGLDQNFSYTTTGGLTPSSFTLNDNGNTTGDSAGNTRTYSNQGAGTYTVTEGTDPAGFAFASLTCKKNGTTDNTGVSGRTVTINLAANDSWVCTYVNNQQLGAIKVTKTAKHAASGPGDHPQQGVNFTVNGVTKATGADGTACFDNLAFGPYDVVETLPAGYSADEADLTKPVTVDSNANCADATYVGESVSFHNTPLTNLTISVDSQVAGGTDTDVSCTNGGPSFNTDSTGDGSGTASNLPPKVGVNAIVCTIVIDP